MTVDIARGHSAGIHVAQGMPGTVSIHVADELTHQAMLLTRREAEELRELLNEIEFDEDEEIQLDQKALTLYNLHTLPTIDRDAYERSANLLNPPFEYEIIQHIKDDDGNVVDSNPVGNL